MSDLSDRSESSGEESGEYLDYEADEYSRYRVRDDDHHDEESGDGDEDEYEETEEARGQDVRIQGGTRKPYKCVSYVQSTNLVR